MKRTRELDEIEIDIAAAEPLSKRAARRLKKGRSLKQAPTTEDIEGSESEASGGDASDDDESKRGEHGIWIGNLSFKTTEQDLVTFFTTLKPLGKAKKPDEYATILPRDITRIALPLKAEQNKGFAHIDFATAEHQETAMALSERILQSRNVLIKAATSFDGRPYVEPVAKVAKSAVRAPLKPPTNILYIGNLPFDATVESLKEHLGGKPTGIKKVRMATFEDSGKCKGFAFVDYESVPQVGAVLSNEEAWNYNGRQLKLEFGEDRSARRRPQRIESQKEAFDARNVTPGSALANAQRGSSAIVASQGKKTSFT